MNVTDMFPAKYLGGRHIETPVLVEIQTVKPERMRAGQGKPEELKYVMYCKRLAGATINGVQMAAGVFGVVLRKKLCEQIMMALGTPDTDEWRGRRIVLYSCEAKAAGEVVISICARAPKAEAQPTTEATPA